MITAGWDSAERVLCVRLDRLGDVLMTTPAVRAVKQSATGRQVILLTSSPGAEAAALVPEIDEVLVYDPPWMKATTADADVDSYAQTIDELRRRRLDAAIVFTRSVRARCRRRSCAGRRIFPAASHTAGRIPINC